MDKTPDRTTDTNPRGSGSRAQPFWSTSDQPLMSISLTAVLAASVLAVEFAATHGTHRVIAVAWVLEAYAVLVGAPVFLTSLVSAPSDDRANKARARRLTISRWGRAPWRRASLLRRSASWLIVASVVWLVISQYVYGWAHVSIFSGVVAGFAIVIGLLIGLAGWLAVLLPDEWLADPEKDVVTLRALIKHEGAPAKGGAIAALLLLVAIGLHLLDLYGVWVF